MVTTSPTPAARTLTNGTIFAHVDFLITGIVMTMLGPLLPILAARWSLNDAQAGNLFLAQYISSTGGMLSSGILVRRYGYRVALILGATLMTVGVAMLAGAGRAFGFAGICILGVGFGTTTPAANLFVSDATPQKRAAALNLLNSSWGVGAMSCPLIIAAAQRMHQTTVFFYLLAGSMGLLALSLASVRFVADEERHIGQMGAHAPGAVDKKILLLVGAMFFIYVGTETAVGGWAASYAQRIAPQSAAMWAMMPAFFYGTLLVGRMAAPLVLLSVRAVKLAAAGSAIALAGVLVLLGGHSITAVMVGSSLAGLGLSTIYPIQVSLLPRWFGGLVTTFSGFMFAIGNFGGGAIPWSVGALSTRFSNLRVGFVVPLLGTASVLAFYSAQSRLLSPDRPKS